MQLSDVKQFEQAELRDNPQCKPETEELARDGFSWPWTGNLPSARSRYMAWARQRKLLCLLVILPNVLSIVYFLLIASPVYRSQASLVVLNSSQGSPSLTSLLSGASGDGAEQGGYVLQEYLGSWDAFRKVDRQIDLKAAYRRGDFVGRFGGLTSLFRSSDVALWRYFQSHVMVGVDQKSGILSLEVDGYDPGTSVRMARALLASAISRMDAMNAQQEQDFVKDAAGRKAAVEEDLKSNLVALARYRSDTGTYDPKELYLSNLALMNSLSMKASDLRSQREAIERSTPANPQVQELGTAMDSVKRDIEHAAGDFPAMARGSSQYEKLVVSRDTNITLLGQANQALQQAQANAEKNRYYLNVISRPSEPLTPERPQRLLWIGGVLLVTLLLWGLLR